MIGYTLLGSNNLEKAIGFYDAVLGELGAKKSFDMGERGQAYSNGKGAMLGVCKPHDGNAATNGNGTMVALVAPDRAAVDRVHATALASGATDEGAPGERGANFYGAYFRDLDGNKLCVFKTG